MTFSEREISQALISGFQNKESRLSAAILDIPGMTTPEFRHFLNRLCSFKSTRYVEIGTLLGATLTSAAFGNDGIFIGIDDNSQWPIINEDFCIHSKINRENVILLEQIFGYNTKDLCLQNLEKLHFSKPRLISADCMQVDPSEISQLDIFFYDGHHGENETKAALKRYLPICKPIILIVDDWNVKHIEKATYEAFESLKINILNSWILKTWNDIFLGLCEYEGK